MVNRMLGLCITAAAGFVVGILTAPRSGEKTRSLLRDKAEDRMRKMEMRRLKLERRVSHVTRDGAHLVAIQSGAVKAAFAAGRRAYLQAAV